MKQVAGIGKYIRIDPPINPSKDVVDLESLLLVASTQGYWVTLDEVYYFYISIHVIVEFHLFFFF